ncbi:MAG: glycosyltransferase family 4 protein [Segetibacter sp.]
MGLPVISTDVGGISEVIDKHNGLLLKSEDEEQLTAAFIQMFTNYKNYNRRQISNSATNLFEYNAVGSLINSVYHEINF